MIRADIEPDILGLLDSSIDEGAITRKEAGQMIANALSQAHLLAMMMKALREFIESEEH